VVEGQLRTYHSKKTDEWKISIQVEKIIQNIEEIAEKKEA
jgi:hypothetical protein